MDVVELDRLAVLSSAELVAAATAADLERPTPCADWNLGELLAHMTVQHRGFAAAARGAGPDLARWEVGPPAADPIGDHAAAAEQVIAAFADGQPASRPFWLPEISTDVPIPGHRAIGFHMIDYVVHGWDVAASLGLPYVLDPRLEEPALRIAAAVPDGASRVAPGAAFRPVLETPQAAAPLDRILSLLGRSPSWAA